MYHKFNLQMFGEATIEGIDEDILKELADELPEEDTAAADDNSDNKQEQEEQPADEHEHEPEQEESREDAEKPKESTSVPYQRFREVNERMKQAEARVKELEAQKENHATPAAAPSVQATPAPAPQKAAEENEFSQEALQKITQMAIANVRVKNQIDDDKLAEMEYSDDPAVKLAYEAAIQEEASRIKQQARQMAAARQEIAAMNEQTYNEFARENAAFMQRSDYGELFAYIKNDMSKNPSREKNMLANSIARLTNKQGTYQDLFVVKTLVSKYIERYEADKKPPAAAPALTNKATKVAGLPKAPEVSGTPSAGEFTLEAAERMIDAGEWDKLPKEVQNKILTGTW